MSLVWHTPPYNVNGRSHQKGRTIMSLGWRTPLYSVNVVHTKKGER